MDEPPMDEPPMDDLPQDPSSKDEPPIDEPPLDDSPLDDSPMDDALPDDPSDDPLGSAARQPGRLNERTFSCPHCWEQVTVLLDPSVSGQTYVEDCEVCCRPIRIHYEMQRGTVARFSAQPAA
jgi:hypothetical protein